MPFQGTVANAGMFSPDNAECDYLMLWSEARHTLWGATVWRPSTWPSGVVCTLRCHLLRSCLLQELQGRIDFSPTQAKMIYDGDGLRWLRAWAETYRQARLPARTLRTRYP